MNYQVCLVVSLILLLVNSACTHTVNIETLAPLAAKERASAIDTSPLAVRTEIPQGLAEKLEPQTSQGGGSVNPEVLPWYLQQSVKLAFDNIMSDGTSTVPSGSHADFAPHIIVRPELWGYYCSQYLYNHPYICWIDVRYRFIDKQGNVRLTLAGEGTGQNQSVVSAIWWAVAAALHSFQRVATEKRGEIMDTFLKREAPDGRQ